MTTLEILALLPLAFWLLLRLDRPRGWPAECRLPDAAGADPAASVVAVVPARDEAEVLPRTLPNLLAQDHPGLRVIVVDDDSSDGTAEVARRLAGDAGRPDRLEVIAAPPRPPGWSGKVHALASGVAAATERFAPEWLLFTDADIRHRPGSVGSLLAQAGRERLDLVSVMARLRADGFWERLLIPPFVYFFQLLYPFRRVKDPRSRVAAAAGGCVLVRREALERAGGVAAIRGALIDDVALGRAIKRSGGRTWLGFDPGIESVRGYPRLADVWRMVARSAFDQLGYRYGLVAAVVVGILVFVVAPPLVLAASLAAAAAGPASATAPLRAALWAALAWTLEALALLPAVRHHRVPPAWALALPFASFFYALMTAASAWEHFHGRGGQWKGRVHEASAPESSA